MSLFIETNKQFYEEHPELNGRPLTLTPQDKALRQEYMKMYKANKKQTTTINKQAPKKTSKCIHTDSENKEGDNKKCTASSLKITRPKDGYILNVPGTKFEYKNKEYVDCDILEIISGPEVKPSKVSVSVTGLSGPCSETHLNNAFNFTEYDLRVIKKTDSSLDFNCFSADFAPDSKFERFKELLSFIFGKRSIDHTINYNLCGCNYQTVLKVFPDLTASASLELKYEWEWKKKGTGTERERGEHKSFEDRLKYSFEVKHSERSVIKIESSEKEDEKEVGWLKFLRSLMENLEYVIAGLSVFLGESQSIKISVSPSFSATCALQEVPGKPFVDRFYKVSIGFKPLFKLEADADVSGTLLLAIPTVGPFLAAIVSAAEAAKAGDVFLGFKIGGSGINLTGDYERQAGELDVEEKLVLNGDIKIVLQGRVAANIHVWRMQYSMGAEVGASSGFKMKDSVLSSDDNGVFFPVVINFLGIVVYWQTWCNTGVDLTSSKIPRAAKMEGASEQDDLENIPEDQKAEIVKAHEVCNDNYYVF